MPNRVPLRALTGIRFFAAFHVLLLHTTLRYLGHAPIWVQNIVGSGYVGVSLFFILSGFILTYSYSPDGHADVTRKREFWAARFARIYPVYALGLLLAGPVFITLARQ